ncbi:MAG TPA: hypothetical protein VE131_14865, partial [Terriglobales bacterium]|nr:hypothetical protein [Terriglobales bacterium]
MRDLPNIERVEVFAFKIPTELPESDGTLEWSDVTLVLVEAYAGDKMGLGYTFADAGTARLIKDKLSQLVTGMSAMAVEASWTAMRSAI